MSEDSFHQMSTSASRGPGRRGRAITSAPRIQDEEHDQTHENNNNNRNTILENIEVETGGRGPNIIPAIPRDEKDRILLQLRPDKRYTQ